MREHVVDKIIRLLRWALRGFDCCCTELQVPSSKFGANIDLEMPETFGWADWQREIGLSSKSDKLCLIVISAKKVTGNVSDLAIGTLKSTELLSVPRISHCILHVLHFFATRKRGCSEPC